MRCITLSSAACSALQYIYIFLHYLITGRIFGGKKYYLPTYPVLFNSRRRLPETKRHSRENLLVSHRAPPQVADRGTLTRYRGHRRNKIPGSGPKLAILPGSFIWIYQGLEEENLNKKSPGPAGWGLMQRASSSLIIK